MVDPYLLYLAAENAKTYAAGLSLGIIGGTIMVYTNAPKEHTKYAFLSVLLANFLLDILDRNLVNDFGIPAGWATGHFGVHTVVSLVGKLRASQNPK